MLLVVVRRVLVSLLETGSILRDVLPETIDAALWPVDRANDRRKIPFFFLFCLLLLPPSFFSFFFFLFFWHLSILRKLSKVCSRRTRGSSVSKSADRYIFFPFVTSFDSLIRYRFSIASQRIFLEDRRVRNSLFSR